MLKILLPTLVVVVYTRKKTSPMLAFFPLYYLSSFMLQFLLTVLHLHPNSLLFTSVADVHPTNQQLPLDPHALRYKQSCTHKTNPYSSSPQFVLKIEYSVISEKQQKYYFFFTRFLLHVKFIIIFIKYGKINGITYELDK